MNKLIKKAISYFIVILLVFVLIGVLINMNVVNNSKTRILEDEIICIEDYDCILILGARVRDNGQPSPILKERLDKGIELYEKGLADKLLMSGDHGRVGYDEVNIMKNYAIHAGIPSEDIFMDHAGFSTYESIYRAKEIFLVDTMIIVTQEYHLYRSLYIAEKLGIEAWGQSADVYSYYGQNNRETREILARVKDYFTCMLKLKPTYLGDKISIYGSGDLTND